MEHKNLEMNRRFFLSLGVAIIILLGGLSAFFSPSKQESEVSIAQASAVDEVSSFQDSV